MNAIRRWPRSNRCRAASSPPRAWSTETEQSSPSRLLPVEQDDEGAAVSQRLEMTDAAGGGRDHDPLHPLFLEQAEVAGLAVRRAVGRADDDRAPLLVHGVLEAADRLRRERVRRVEHDGAEAAAVAATHLVGRGAPDEADPLDHLEDPRERLRGDDIRPVQDVRRGAERDSGLLGDVADRHPA